jgi:VanZ family protein
VSHAPPAPRGLAAWWPAVGYMLLIWAVSSTSSPPSIHTVPFRDKILHFIEYAVLAMLLARALRLTRPSDRAMLTWFFAAASASFFGLTDEIHQAYVPNRNADPFDLLADAVGAVFGAALYLVVSRLARKRAQ